MKISYYDWYQLRAAFTHIYSKRIVQIEKLKTSSLGALKFKTVDVQQFSLNPAYFKLYNSFQRNSDGAIGSPAEPYETMTLFGVFLWFVRRNFLSLLVRGSVILLFIWAACFGGVSKISTWYIERFTSIEVFSKKTSLSKKNAVKTSSVVASPTSSNLPVSLADYKPVLFWGDSVYLLSGERLFLGYKFKTGVFKNEVVSEVNFSDRFYRVGEYVFRLY